MADTPQVTPNDLHSIDSYRVRVTYSIPSLDSEFSSLFDIRRTTEVTVQVKSILLVQRTVLGVLRREYSPNAVIRKMRVERVAPEVKS